MAATAEGAGIAWVLVAAGLSLVAGPGLVLFHGAVMRPAEKRDAVRRALVALVLLVAQWIVLGRWIAGGPAVAGGLRMVLAVLVPSVVVAGFVEALTLRGYAAFVLGWATLVYEPMARWIAGPGLVWDAGRILDFGGGISVHLTAGIAALVAARGLLGADAGRGADAAEAPGSGAGALSLGVVWLACCMSGAIGHREIAGLALAATALGGAGGAFGRCVVEWREGGRATGRSAGAGMVAGLAAIASGAGYVSGSAAFAIGFIAGAVSDGSPLGFVSGSLAAVLAITAAAGYVGPATAISIGALVAALCYFAAVVQRRLPAGRARVAFALHAIGGGLGAVLTGVFAQRGLNPAGADGALFGDGRRLAVQLAACVVAAAYAGVVTWALVRALDALGPRWRARESVPPAPLESRPTLASGVFHARGLRGDALTLESLLDGPADTDAAGAAKS